MRGAKIDAKEPEEVMFLEARVDVRGILDSGGARGDVGDDSGTVEVSGAERTALPDSAVLYGVNVVI